MGYEGNDLEVGFNVNYLLDALAAIDGQEVELGLTDSNSSCLIRSPGNTSARYVVMPHEAVTPCRCGDCRSPIFGACSRPSWSFDPRFTLISGPNASGKTSLLEAIYMLGRGRSFRTPKLTNLIRTGAERFVVFGEVDLPERRLGLGIQGTIDGVRARMGGDRVASLAELAVALPVQIIDPEVHRLIEEGPSRRRRFLDWGVFHVERTFIGEWQKYQQVLKQRNAALRLRQPEAVVSAWNADLLRFGERIDGLRKAYVGLLMPVAAVLTQTLLRMELSLTYRSGWAQDLGFQAALAQSWVRDQELGSTSVGPQRAELSIRLDGVPVKDRISRGQQKLLAAALFDLPIAAVPLRLPGPAHAAAR